MKTRLFIAIASVLALFLDTAKAVDYDLKAAIAQGHTSITYGASGDYEEYSVVTPTSIDFTCLGYAVHGDTMNGTSNCYAKITLSNLTIVGADVTASVILTFTKIDGTGTLDKGTVTITNGVLKTQGPVTGARQLEYADGLVNFNLDMAQGDPYLINWISGSWDWTPPVYVPTTPTTFAASPTKFTYNGGSQGPTITPNPANATWTVTAGQQTAINAGGYSVTATANGSFTGSGTYAWEIAKATASITLGSLSPIYDGTAKSATASTNPTGLAVAFTYNGSSSAPIAPGTYTVVGTINDTNYTGSDTGTLTIGKASATVSLGGLTQTYDGSSKPATATTTPAGLGVAFTYDGSGTAPIAPGTYPVVGAINDANYQGSATGTLTINKAVQQPLTLICASNQTCNTPQTLTSTGGSGTGSVTYGIVAQSAPGSATLTGDQLTATANTGWVDVQAIKAADSIYQSVTSSTVRITLAPAPTSKDEHLTITGPSGQAKLNP